MIELPDPDTHCFDDESGTPKDVWSYSKELVQEIVAKAVLEEREACTKVCADLHMATTFGQNNAALYHEACNDCADAIRARSQS